MHIHYFQHVPFESPAYILTWAKLNDHTVSATKIYESVEFPDVSLIDLLVVMGGPMGAHQYKEYPWLRSERAFIKQAVLAGKKVLGICLGGQIIADVLKGTVAPNPKKEIGWFDTHLSTEARQTKAFKNFPEKFSAFHWHGDTFSIPQSAVHIASSEACSNQAFVYSENVIGLQFHLESTEASINSLIENCSNELVDDKYIQTAAQLREQSVEKVPKINALMELMLSDWLN